MFFKKEMLITLCSKFFFMQYKEDNDLSIKQNKVYSLFSHIIRTCLARMLDLFRPPLFTFVTNLRLSLRAKLNLISQKKGKRKVQVVTQS